MSAPYRVGVYLGVVQFCFALTWVVYVIYLPQLAVATLARLAFVAAGLGAVPAVSAVLGWLPVVAWLAAGALLLVATGSARSTGVA